ncbi:MAG TPA: PilZ domain-containing protein [Desulfuromonadales bacterium]|nr:PilZ domain-containing protein [Desulfuromonadales bacterium]
MFSQYSVTPKHEPGQDNDEIISLLSEYQALLRPITVLNYYRELPITSESLLSRFDYHKFEIAVTGIHEQVIRHQLQTILRLEGCTVLAECSPVKSQKDRRSIFGFRFIELHAAKREAFRLNIDVELIVDFRNQQGKIPARMIDISMTGCRIKFESGTVSIGMLVVLEIRIFDQSKSKELTRSIAARVVKTYDDTINYCCLEFIGTPKEQDLLARYINQHQTSLIREFREKRILPA